MNLKGVDPVWKDEANIFFVPARSKYAGQSYARSKYAGQSYDMPAASTQVSLGGWLVCRRFVHGLCTLHDTPGSAAHSQHKGTVNGDDEVSTYLLAYVLACPRTCQQLAHVMDPHGRALLRLG